MLIMGMLQPTGSQGLTYPEYFYLPEFQNFVYFKTNYAQFLGNCHVII